MKPYPNNEHDYADAMKYKYAIAKMETKPNPKKHRKQVKRYIREKMNEGTPYPEGMPNLPPLPPGYDYWEYVPEGLTGPQHDNWERCKKDKGCWSGNTRPTPQGDATLRNKEDYWDIRAVKRNAPKIKPITSTIVIDLPASAIVFTEDDGTPMREPVAVKQSNIKRIKWNFSFGDFDTSNNFHIHKLPISAGAIDLLPTSTLKQSSMLPYPKTEAGKQYYCVMVYAESYKELKSLQEIMLCSIGTHKGNDTPSVIVRSGNNEAVLTKGAIASAAIGHQYICWIDNADPMMKRRYLAQIILEPSKLTYL